MHLVTVNLVVSAHNKEETGGSYIIICPELGGNSYMVAAHMYFHCKADHLLFL